jgi:hypothetical protein
MRRRILATTAAALAASFLFLGLAAVPAGAKTKPTDSDLGIYEAANIAVSTLGAQATIPSYSCKKADQVAVYDDTYDEDASSFSGVYVDLACGTHNVPAPSVSLEIDGAYDYPTITITPGDNVSMSVTCGPTGTMVSLYDATSGKTASEPSSAASDCNGAFVGNIGVTKGAGPKLSPLPDFGSVTFTNVNVNDAAIGTYSTATTNYYEGKKDQIDVGPLTDSGTSFTNTQVS